MALLRMLLAAALAMPIGADDKSERRVARAPFRGWVELCVAGDRRRAAGLDLSPHGVGVSLAEPWPRARERVEAEFALPGIGLPLVIEGRIAWSSRDGRRLGIAFHDVDPGLTELLEGFVSGRLG
ncbi:MAG TPA: PilZ domain-containing protein [Myxococcota bacterium]|jgi:hypothetical protein|nr:PilZ domain-containing protein [Myxococcota bacterium]